MATTGDTQRRQSLTLPAYAAAIWAFAFVLVSFYWAAGGTFGGDTLARSIEEQSRNPTGSFLAIVWVTGVLKALVGLLALAIVHSWGAHIPRWFVLLGVWTAGIIFTLYGLVGIIENLLWETGMRDVPASFGADCVRWYLFFWEPFWLLGGILFLLTAWQARRSASRTNVVSQS